MKGMRLLPLALCLAACSPYEYSTEVAGIGTGVDQLAAAIEAGYANLAADTATATRQRLVDARLPVKVAASCEASSARSQQPCAFFGVDERTEPALPVLYKSRPQLKKAIIGLTSYAHALQAVTNAADRKAYDEATKRVEGGVKNLAAGADVILPGASVIAPAAVNAALWVVGAALDTDRFETLKDAVNNGALYMPKVADYVAQALDEINNSRRDVLVADIKVTAKLLGPRLTTAAYEKRYDLAEGKRAKLDALLHTSALQAKDDLLQAHKELVNAVNDPHRSIGPLVSAVAEFAAAAKNVHDAVARH